MKIFNRLDGASVYKGLIGDKNNERVQDRYAKFYEIQLMDLIGEDGKFKFPELRPVCGEHMSQDLSGTYVITCYNFLEPKTVIVEMFADDTVEEMCQKFWKIGSIDKALLEEKAKDIDNLTSPVFRIYLFNGFN